MIKPVILASVQQRLEGAIAVLQERINHPAEPLGDVIRATHDRCLNALSNTIGTEENVIARSHVQRLTGKLLALQQLHWYPYRLLFLLNQYQRILSLSEKMPETLSLKDVACVYHPAETTLETVAYEFVAPENLQTKLLKNAIQLGRTDAKLFLGKKYSDIRLLKSAALDGSLDAQFEHALHERPKDAAMGIRGAASQGHVDAQNFLANMYLIGREVEKNNTEAIKWFREAADQGHAQAQAQLGVMFTDYQDVTRNDAEAMKWYSKAAKQGHALAQNNLGVFYQNGRAVEKNHTEAIELYNRAADQGHMHAQNNLGFCYQHGLGIEKNEVQAMSWYRKAANQGHVQAQQNLGYAHAHGLGVNKDETVAISWYRKAADQGSAQAQAVIGFAYANGRGVAKNLAEAQLWYRKAADQGYHAARARSPIG